MQAGSDRLDSEGFLYQEKIPKNVNSSGGKSMHITHKYSVH